MSIRRTPVARSNAARRHFSRGARSAAPATVSSSAGRWERRRAGNRNNTKKDKSDLDNNALRFDNGIVLMHVGFGLACIAEYFMSSKFSLFCGRV